jgi:hypothetical protein
MRRGLWLLLTLTAGLSGNPGIAAGFAMADDANRRKAAPPSQGTPIAQRRMWPKIRLYAIVLLGGYSGEHHVSPKKNISANQTISAT